MQLSTTGSLAGSLVIRYCNEHRSVCKTHSVGTDQTIFNTRKCTGAQNKDHSSQQDSYYRRAVPQTKTLVNITHNRCPLKGLKLAEGEYCAMSVGGISTQEDMLES